LFGSKPNDQRAELNHRQEVQRELLEAHGDAASALDALKEVLDQVALFVSHAIERAHRFSMRAHRDDDGATLLQRLSNHGICVVALRFAQLVTWSHASTSIPLPRSWKIFSSLLPPGEGSGMRGNFSRGGFEN